ncbi:surface lipoprotein assembly modifier [Litorivita sp. NS0012-18]|uniref:surface lipoprotein assembly modifier n=1 Tax=Litorivita sp. NS0012-18 TaxID=3127655 RepID=UPI003102826C
MARGPAIGRAAAQTAACAAALLLWPLGAAAQTALPAPATSLAASPPASPSGTPAQSVTLDLAQARAIGVAALNDGRPEVARDIARALIARDAKDGFARYLLGEALSRLGQPAEGRASAAQAFRLAPQKHDRFRAAQLAAKLSFDAGQPTRAQYWLRRSLPFAPHDQARGQVARDYAQVRAINPLSFNINLNASPSSNVNGGADTEFHQIDGTTLVGTIGAHDQALKGVVISADLQAAYRLRESAKSETRLIASLGVSRVILSQEAYDLAAATPTPLDDDIKNSDFGSTTARIGLRHGFALPLGTGHSGALSASVGQTWYAGAAYQDLMRIGAESHWRLAERTGLSLDLAAEERRYKSRTLGVTRSKSATARLSHRLGNDDRAALSLSYTDTDGTGRNSSYARLTAYANYAFAEPIGPAKISLGLGVSKLDGLYQAFITTAREDHSVFGTVDFVFHDFDYAGFAPSLTLRARKNRSNVSRYDTTEVSLGLGIKSSF